MTSRVAIAAVAAAVAVSFQPAYALDTIRVGKSVPIAWTFTPLDIGVDTGIWEKHGLKLDITSFGGDAKVQQALAANGVDFALGSGPGMGFAAKGVPAKAVAAFAGQPDNISIVIGANAPYNDIIAVPLGSFETNYAAFKTGQVDGIMLATETSMMLVEKKEAKIIANMGAFAPKFHTHVIYARDELIDKNPDLIKRFLAGWFETIAWIKANKDKSVEISARVLKLDKDVVSRAYDIEIAMMQDNGRFDPEAIKVIKSSLVDMHILEQEPTDAQMFTTKFVQ